ncbi:hypothetical protein [Archangium sp.]|uniref:hypothetical protein n=1 Tax=Archangium sp. TaxID=1872627 RepID=UPI00389A74A5
MATRLMGLRPGRARSRPGLGVFSIAVLVAQSACVTAAPGGPHSTSPGHYAYSTAPVGIDSPSATCRNSLSACAALYGKEAATTAAVLKVVLDETARKSIEEALSKCADSARTEVLLRHEGQFERVFPSADECRQMTQNKGRKMSWAQRLGEQMHEVAEACADKALGALRKGRYSLEQRYRILDPETGEKKLVSAEAAEALVESGNAGELTGTLVPDVVIHEGDPLTAQAVYDFKFPCVNTDRAPDWNWYPDEHPFEGKTQKTVYQKYIAPIVARVVPWLGIVP